MPIPPAVRSTTRTNVRRVLAAAAGAAVLFAPTGCATLSSDSPMAWVAGQAPSGDAVDLPTFRAVPAVDGLTAQDMARALGEDLEGARVEGGSLLGTTGWSVTVDEGSSGVRVKYVRACGELVTEEEPVRASAMRALGALGDDPGRYDWFTLTDAQGNFRVVGEPMIDGHRTWTTGLLTAVVDARGVCVLSGTLMEFTQTGEEVRLGSPLEVFARIQSDEAMLVEGDFDQVTPTWTLGDGGEVIPAWVFSGTGPSVVAVDFGTGLEAALDTESYLSSSS